MNKETIVTSAFRVLMLSCSLAAALLDGLFEHPAGLVLFLLQPRRLSRFCCAEIGLLWSVREHSMQDGWIDYQPGSA